MTRAFSPSQRLVILERHEAYVLTQGGMIHVREYMIGRGATSRFKALRKVATAIMCACGCDVWAPLSDIQFDHIDPHCYGGRTTISNGRPLTVACHRIKSRGEHAATARDDRIRRKLSVATGIEKGSPQPTACSGRSWPQRSLSNPNWKRCFDGRLERRGA